jgi:RHS repeat-associated protein
LGIQNPFRYRGYVYDQETGLYYLQTRYYDPELGRFISADGFVSTGQGFAGCNMFAYCNNNPITEYDSSGAFGCTITGGLAGGLVGGISSAINGESFWAGAAQGAVSGAISGAAVDFVVWSGGTGAVALLVVGFGGMAGSIAGDAVYSEITDTEFDWLRTGGNAVVAGALNVVSFGYSNCLFNKADFNSFAEYLIKPTISDIPGFIITDNLVVIDAMTNVVIDWVYTTK